MHLISVYDLWMSHRCDFFKWFRSLLPPLFEARSSMCWICPISTTSPDFWLCIWIHAAVCGTDALPSSVQAPHISASTLLRSNFTKNMNWALISRSFNAAYLKVALVTIVEGWLILTMFYLLCTVTITYHCHVWFVWTQTPLWHLSTLWYEPVKCNTSVSHYLWLLAVQGFSWGHLTMGCAIFV